MISCVNLSYAHHFNRGVIDIYKKPNRQFDTNKDVEEIEYTQVERGVKVIKARPNRYGGTDGDCFFFQLNEMNAEQLARYGLRSTYEKYKARETS